MPEICHADEKTVTEHSEDIGMLKNIAVNHEGRLVSLETGFSGLGKKLDKIILLLAVVVAMSVAFFFKGDVCSLLMRVLERLLG